jgi:hypothetical protein
MTIIYYTTSVKAMVVERAEGAAGGIGPAPCAGTVWCRLATDVPQHVFFANRHIFFFNIPGMPTVRLVLDHKAVDPQTAAYSGSGAATEKLYAAGWQRR